MICVQILPSVFHGRRQARCPRDPDPLSYLPPLLVLLSCLAHHSVQLYPSAHEVIVAAGVFASLEDAEVAKSDAACTLHLPRSCAERIGAKRGVVGVLLPPPPQSSSVCSFRFAVRTSCLHRCACMCLPHMSALWHVPPRTRSVVHCAP
eukprot:2764871-Rhodomonas_salina.1